MSENGKGKSQFKLKMSTMKPMFPGQNEVWVPADVIPHGLYCYDERGTCPCWGRSTHHPEQENGYCTYLMQKDWEWEGISLLWDRVKECNVNAEWEEDPTQDEPPS